MTPPDEQVTKAMVEVERLYSGGVERYGAEPRSVGWRDEDSQRLRFEKLAQLLASAPARPITVNDVGCGYGSLFGFLDALGGVDLAGYHGYDISRPMLDRARIATDDRAELVLSAEPTLLADYSFASGPFNVKGACADGPWQAHVMDIVRAMAAKSRLGFAFNLLTTFVDFRQDDLFYADPVAFFAFCKRDVSPYVTLVHDYPLYEWTMLVHLPPTGAPPVPAAG
jgi:SAM-dependent methyltransferase